MDDLISRQAAIDMLEERLQANGYSNVALVSELNRSIGYLMQLPSVQPTHGQWKKAYADHEAFGERPFYRYCSECCEVTVFPYKFCPNCGAYMMDEEEQNETD